MVEKDNLIKLYLLYNLASETELCLAPFMSLEAGEACGDEK